LTLANEVEGRGLPYPLADERARNAHAFPAGRTASCLFNRVLARQRVTTILVRQRLGV